MLIKIAATVCGIGYLPWFPGTWASIAGVLLYLATRHNTGVYVILTVTALVVGFLVSGRAEKIFDKKDSRFIVIDELAALLVLLYFVPNTVVAVGAAFVFFRLFDIVKPFPIRALEKLAGSTVQLKSANQALAPMYISNPFRQKGKAAADLSSTHPPISERVRILRSMGGASLADYEAAYESAHKGGGHAMTAATIAGGAIAGIRAAEPEPSKVERTREVSDLMWRQNNYKAIECDCGTKLKVPPKLKGKNVKCPHCGRIHQV